MSGIRCLANLAERSAVTGVDLIEQCEQPTRYTAFPPAIAHAGPIDSQNRAWADGFLAHIEAESPAISIYRIKDCFITPNAAIVTFAGAVVAESLYPYVRSSDIANAFFPFIQHDASWPEDDVSMLLHNLTRVNEPVLFGREHGESGYFHWLHSILPRAEIYSRNRFGPRRLLVALSSSFQRESLESIGWSSDRLLCSDGNTMICNELIFCTPMVFPDTDRSGGFFERAVHANAVLQNLAIGLGQTLSGRRIFISRSDAAIRRLADEDVVMARLESLGFERALLGCMPFVEQVHLFHSASVVVGMHGAGLSNIAFMPRGGKVVEILTPDRLWPTYRGVAARSGLEHFPYVGTRAGEICETDSDVSVDVAHFIEFVVEVCKDQ
jgi:hypothetical protein